MIFLALAAGGAAQAVLELHRSRHKNSKNPTAQALLSRESDLKEALKEAQEALDREKTERRQDQIAADDLARHNATLEAKAAALQEAKDALEDHSKQLVTRFEQLEAQASGLQETNEALLQQVADLKVDSDAELARTVEQVAELKREVAAAVQSWSDGTLNTAGFLNSMTALGVDVQCLPESLPALPSADTLATGDLQLAFNSSWANKMQLAIDNRDRMSRLLMSAAARQAGTAHQAGTPGRPPLPEAAFPSAKTPPRDAGMSRRLEMAGFSVPGVTPRGLRDMSQVLLETAPKGSGLSGSSSLTGGSLNTVSSKLNATAQLPPQQPAETPVAGSTSATVAHSRAAPRMALQPIDNTAAAGLDTHTILGLAKGGDVKKALPKKQQRVVMPRLQFVDSDNFDSSARDVMRI